ncbi:MAG: endolytic transglycosylase MltG [Hyphomonadaceae bacterium]
MGKLIGILFSLVIVAAVAAGAGWFWLDGVYSADGPATADGKPRVVMIDRGSSTQAIATKLKEAGAIADDGQFRLALRVREVLGEKPAMKAGEYELKSGASMAAIVKELCEGSALQYAVVVPEGLTSQMILSMLVDREWKATGGAEQTYKLAGPVPAVPAEGVLLPGDYAVTRGDTVESVINRMIKAQQDLLDELWPNRQPGLPLKTREEAVNLASIVENETGVPHERPQVASLFINRLNKPMRLQSDPTIVYGITRGVPLGHGLRVSEIAQKSDWNTYQIDGLPKTPICNPGRESIKAVLNPAQTNYIYFVADGTGGHAFAETLGEHNANVSKWREFEQQRDAKGPAAVSSDGAKPRP